MTGLPLEHEKEKKNLLLPFNVCVQFLFKKQNGDCI